MTVVEKMLSLESDIEGKLKNQEQMDNSLLNKINELHNSSDGSFTNLQNQLTNLDSENQNNIQQIFNIKETINIQSQEAKKIEDERQIADNKARDDIEVNVQIMPRLFLIK